MNGVTRTDLDDAELAALSNQPGLAILIADTGSREGSGVFSCHNDDHGIIFQATDGRVMWGIKLSGGTRAERVEMARRAVASLAERTGGQLV